MKKLTVHAFDEIQHWVHKNARPIDLAVWQYHFEGGSAEAVIQELAFYQNADGGFGNALEPDSWNPASSPYTTLQAIRIMLAIGCGFRAHPIMKRVLRYLDECPCQREYGWLFSIPTNNDYAHAPWWSYSEEANTYESIGLTAELAGIILYLEEKDTPLYKKAEAYAAFVIKRLETAQVHGDMGLGGYLMLVEYIKKAGITKQYDVDFLTCTLSKQVFDTIERDTAKWVQYCAHPSRYITSAQSLAYTENEAIVQAELDFLIETRPQNGIWPIPWSWFDHNGKYPKQFAISENWWRAIKGTEKVLYLKQFGRLES